MFAQLFSRKAASTETSAAADAGLPQMPFPIILTDQAQKMVQEAIAQDPEAGSVLRVGVTGGGCSGLQYMLDFAPPATDFDFVDTQGAVTVCIDPFSAAHLAGTTIDYVDGLSGTGFRFENPNVVRACGCGSSFQT